MTGADSPPTDSIESPPATDETKVFLSYSRKDSVLMRRIADALIANNDFEPDFDKADHDPDRVNAGISADEPWWQRLEEMIASAEAMVFLVSPDSIASRVCDEEIAYAQRLGKRVIPVLAAPIDFAKLPPKLAALNIAIDFTEAGPGFDGAFGQVARVLAINSAWLREGRQYAERAAAWERKGAPKGGLLPSGAFEEAEAWAARRPKNEPEPGELFTAWIAASRANIQEQLGRERRQIRRARIWQAAAALILVLGFSALATGSWFLISEQRAFSKSRSLMLARTAEQFHNDGDPRRALLLSILASQDSTLSPTTPEARAVFASSAQTMKQLAALRHEGPVNGAAFSQDETRILTWSADATAKLWDTTTGAQIGPAFRHEGPVNGAAFSQDGTRILTWSGNPYTGTGDVRLWDAATGEQIGLAIQHDGTVLGAAFSQDATRILTWSRDATARLWDTATGKQIGPTLPHEGPVKGAVFSQDETRILTWSDDNTAKLWDAATGAQIGPALRHGGPVKGAAFSQDEARILTWSADDTARPWDAATGEQIGPALQHESYLVGAAFSQDETRILTWSGDISAGRGDARLWDTATGKQIGPALAHESLLFGAAFSRNETRILTWSADATARLWDIATGQQIGPALAHEGGVWGAAFSRDETRILTWSADATARLWDASFSREDSVNVAWSEDGNTRLLAPAAVEKIGPAIQYDDTIRGGALSPDGGRVLTWSDDTAKLWDVATGKQVGHDLLHAGQLLGAAFSRNGALILTWRADRTARLWDAATGKQIGPAVQHEYDIFGAAFSLDETRFLTWSEDATVRLWDVATGKQIGSAFYNDSTVSAAAFSQDETRILIWSDDNTARLWDVSWAMRSGASPEDIAEVCDLKLRGSLTPTTTGAEAPFPHLIDEEIVTAAPILRGREGENVCAPVDPPWYDKLFGFTLGWALR
ncbi:MAG: TIR domain-containing protein [Hyphomonadaceae bacterium]